MRKILVPEFAASWVHQTAQQHWLLDLVHHDDNCHCRGCVKVAAEHAGSREMLCSLSQVLLDVTSGKLAGGEPQSAAAQLHPQYWALL